MLGAGPIGGTVAATLALAGAVREVVIADALAPAVAAGKALDILQACPIVGSDTRVSGSADMTAAADDLVIVADRGSDGREWQDEQALAVLARALPSTVGPVLFAGGAQAWLQEKAIVELGVRWERAVGTASAAMEGAARAMAALEAGCGVRDVSLSVVGRTGMPMVVWEWARIEGRPAIERLDAPAVRRVDDRLRVLWPPPPYAAASAAASVVDALAGGRQPTVSILCRPAGRARVLSLPVRLGSAGIGEVVMPDVARLATVLAD